MHNSFFRRLLPLLTLMLLLPMAASMAQKKGKAKPKAPARNELQSNLHTLWRVSTDSSSIYVLGSVHMLKKENYPLDTVIERAFDRSEGLVLEINLDSVDQSEVLMSLMTRGRLEDGKTLKTVLSKDTYKKASAQLKKMGLEIGMLETFKPWVLGFMLMAQGTGQQGYEAQYGIDMYFAGRAREAGMPVFGLETVDYQISIFDDLSLEEQEAFVAQTLSTKGGDEKMLDRMVDAWERGDTATLGAEMRGSDMRGGMGEKLLYERNRNWMPAIEGYLRDKKKYIVVVGAAHLAGSEGVIDMLAKRGYRVEQL